MNVEPIARTSQSERFALLLCPQHCNVFLDSTTASSRTVKRGGREILPAGPSQIEAQPSIVTLPPTHALKLTADFIDVCLAVLDINNKAHWTEMKFCSWALSHDWKVLKR